MRLTVVYSEKMVGVVDSYSPSAYKPKLVLDAWKNSNEDIITVEAQAAYHEQISIAHDPDYVSGVLSCTVPNGFGTKDKSIADSLRYTVGGMLTAVQLIAQDKDAYPVVCVPVSGFHHAAFDRGGGYCTFNGLVIAAMHANKRVAIVDCDQHWGDGTDDCLRRLDSSNIKHNSFGESYYEPKHAKAYLTELRDLWVSGWFDDTDLILYQAGADVWVDDPLGGVLSEADMIQRDYIMFEGAKNAGIPLIWNFAGGYSDQDSIIRLHTNTLHACLNTYL